MNGQEIVNRRRQLGLSQADLAELLGATALEIGLYERGEALPSADKARSLSSALDGVPFGERLSLARESLGWSQVTTAEFFGVSGTTVCHWEAQKCAPRPRDFPRLEARLQKMEDLASRAGSPAPEPSSSDLPPSTITVGITADELRLLMLEFSEQARSLVGDIVEEVTERVLRSLTRDGVRPQ